VQLDLDIHAGGEVKLHQRIDGFVVGVNDVKYALVGAGLILIARIFVSVRLHQNGVALDFGRKRDRAYDLRPGPLRGFHNFTRRLVDQTMIVSLEANSNSLLCHGLSL